MPPSRTCKRPSTPRPICFRRRCQQIGRASCRERGEISGGLFRSVPAETMASAVTTPLERQFGQMPSLTQMTSVSSFGSSQITVQFSLERDIDAAEQDVQAAINAASNLLPKTLPTDRKSVV